MDPATLALTVTTFLSPLIAKAGEKAAEEVGKKLPEAAGKLWQAVAARFSGQPAAEGAAKELAAKADDQDNQEAFTVQLRKILKEDEAFAAELAQLLQSAQSAIGSGALAGGEGVAAGAGGVAIGGDVEGGITVGRKKKS